MEHQHYGVARWIVEGDAAIAQQYRHRAQMCLAGLLDRLRLGGIDSGAFSQRFDDTAYCYVSVAGGVNVIEIVVQSTGKKETITTAPVEGVPDFVSGVVTDGLMYTAKDILKGDLDVQYVKAFWPTLQTTKVHLELAAGQPYGMQRLSVVAAVIFPEFQAPSSDNGYTGPPYSQYKLMRPTYWSGRMKRVVQFLMGFGRQAPPAYQQDYTVIGWNGDSVDTNQMPSIYANVLLNLAAGKTVGTDGNTVDLNAAPAAQATQQVLDDYQQGVVRDGLAIQYDYRFSVTHGITVGADGALWLVEISITNGVIAMPLPLMELTKRPLVPEDGSTPPPWNFYNALEDLTVTDILVSSSGWKAQAYPHIYDEDGIRALNEFGGFPTGEGFNYVYLKNQIRAGEVLQLVTPEGMAAFYKLSMYSSAMGWAFNDDGSEAHNTGYYFEEGEPGYQKGAWYSIPIRIGATNEHAKVDGADAVAKRVLGAKDVNPVLAQILARKAARLEAFQVKEIQSQTGLSDADFIEYLDDMAVYPIATGSAHLAFMNEGYLSNPGKTPFYQIKFYEPMMGFLVSHDFTPANGNYLAPLKACDTTMHVFFDGQDFKWVRYFADPNSYPPQVTDTTENCMYQGDWEVSIDNDVRNVTRGFYTSDYDDRQEVSDSTTNTQYKGEAMGATAIIGIDDISDFRRAAFHKEYSFKMTTTTTSTVGRDVYTGIAVPLGVREAYYMGAMQYAGEVQTSVGYAYKKLNDPYTYETWVCATSTAGPMVTPSDMLDCMKCPALTTQQGVDSVAVFWGDRLMRYQYSSPNDCTDLIDTGPWASHCTNMDNMRYSVELPALPDPTNTTSKNVGDLEVRLVMAGGPRKAVTRKQHMQDGSWSNPHWFLPSPDPETGFVDFIAASFNALGDSDSSVYDNDLNLIAGSTKYGSPAYDAMGSDNSCYIGVING